MATLPAGLSAEEARHRLRRFGPNELPISGRRDLPRIALDALREPLLMLLLAASAIYFIIGDIHDAALLLALGLLNIGLVVFQENRTERTLESLRDLSSPRALVIRDGARQRIAGRDVVPDDLLALSEGDRVAADAILISSTQLAADESLLTGESAPVRKVAVSSEAVTGRPGGDDLPWVFAGSLIVSGHGIARVTRTGVSTEMGNIGKSLASLETQKTRLHKVTTTLARNAAIYGALVSVIVVVLHGLRSADWIAAVLAGVTIAMSMLPEEIPVVLTIFLTLGAWRISRRRVLARRAATIETLGAATVLCTDKTGTLTVNRMSVVELWAGAGSSLPAEGTAPSPGEPSSLAEIGVLACNPHPADPMEQAFHRLMKSPSSIARDAPEREYGLSRDLLAVGYVWKGPSGGDLIVAAKGAPEAIVDLCGLHGAERDAVLAQVAAMATRGLRVLGIAKAAHQGRLPESLRGFAFRFCGLAGLEDPVRETVPAAVTECRHAGIRVIMITGDYPQTALAIARQAGIDTSGGVVTGPELAAMGDPQLVASLQSVRVFARIMPEQKLRLVQSLQGSGEIVAMTGDGVNDAPALKAADIGVAMGGRGTDVAREAAGLVLLDDAFESIAAAIRLGRRIFDNLRKALSYILAVHVPIAGLAIVPLLIGWPIVFFPIHVVFLEFVIDPVCSVVFEAEPEEQDIMDRPPRAPDAPLFGFREVTFGILQGLVGLAAVLGALGLSLHTGASEAESRTITFVTLVAVNIGLVFSNRSWNHPAYQSLQRYNAALWWVLLVMVAALAGAIFIPAAAEIFRFSALRQDQFALSIGMAAIAFLIIELLKLVRYIIRHGWPRFPMALSVL